MGNCNLSKFMKQSTRRQTAHLSTTIRTHSLLDPAAHSSCRISTSWTKWLTSLVNASLRELSMPRVPPPTVSSKLLTMYPDLPRPISSMELESEPHFSSASPPSQVSVAPTTVTETPAALPSSSTPRREITTWSETTPPSSS